MEENQLNLIDYFWVFYRVFQNSELMSREIGLSKELIDGIYNIWIALTCTLPICPDKFQLHCDYVLGLYNQEMTKEIVTGKKRKRVRREVWYPPSPTLHKILFHGADVIRLIPRTLMLGQLSEVYLIMYFLKIFFVKLGFVRRPQKFCEITAF